MADDDNLQRQTFNQRTTPEADAAGAALAALAAIAGGAFVRATEIVAIAAEGAGVAAIPIDSVCIAELRYHIATGLLEVDFVDGSMYPYHHVSMLALLQWLNAPSKGSYYNTVVRGKWT